MTTEMNEKNPSGNKKEALTRLMHLCSRQEKCTYDIRIKLKNWNLSVEDTEQIVRQLKEDKYLDDERYARFFVRDKFAFNKWGRQKIRYMLHAKSIDNSIIEKALTELSDDEYHQTLLDELKKKRKHLSGNNLFQLKAKLFNFASQRGFESNLTYNAIDQILSQDN